MLFGVFVLAVVLFHLRPKKQADLPVAEKALDDTQVPPRNSTRLSPAPETEKDEGLNTMPVYPSSQIDPGAAKQTYEAYLVLDVEATCQAGTDFNYANEIIASHPFLTTLSHFASSHRVHGYTGMARVSPTLETQGRSREGK